MMYTFSESIAGSDITIFEHEGEISLTISEKFKDKNKNTRSRNANCWLKKDNAMKIAALLTEFADTIIYNEDKQSGDFTAYYQSRPHIVSQGRNKDEANRLLIELLYKSFKS